MLAPPEIPKNLYSLSTSFEKLEISKSLNEKKDQYLRNIRTQKRKTRLHVKRLGTFSMNTLSNQLDTIQLQEDNFGQGLLLRDYIDDCLRQTFKFEQFNEVLSSLFSNNLYRQHFGVIGLRKLLSHETDPPIQPAIEAGAVPRLLEFTGKSDEYHLQLEATWALSNLVSGTTEQTKQVIDQGAIPAMLNLLEGQHKDVRHQAMWALGNIAGDNTEYRDAILNAGGLDPIMRLLEGAISEGNSRRVQDGTWALSNLCRGKPFPPYNRIKGAVPVLAQVVMIQEDVSVLSDALWSLSFLSEGDGTRIDAILKTGVVPSLVKCLDNPFISVLNPSLKTLGNLFTGTTEQVDILLEIHGFVEKLFTLLQHKKESIRKEVSWILSNIAAGTPQHIDRILANACDLDAIFFVATKDSLIVKKEAAWILSNIIQCGNNEQRRVLFERGVVEYFGNLIMEEDVGLLKVGLSTLSEISKLSVYEAPEELSMYASWAAFQQMNIVAAIEKLQYHSDSTICELASNILDWNRVEPAEGEGQTGSAWGF